jgi:hypothetical protein
MTVATGNWQAGILKHPCAANLTRDALDYRALRPIDSCHSIRVGRQQRFRKCRHIRIMG